VTMQILDAIGNVLFTLTANAGQPAATSHVYLKAGNYVVRLTAADGAPVVNYLLTGRLISDPIGPRTDDGADGGGKSVNAWDGSAGTTTDPCWDQAYYW